MQGYSILKYIIADYRKFAKTFYFPWQNQGFNGNNKNSLGIIQGSCPLRIS